MSAMLLMYNFLLRPDFINGLIDVSSHKDYTLFIQKDAFTETARSLYGSW
jgi:hypothetical protein